MSKHMTLKQRRRHRELVAEFDRLKPKLPPIDFELGKDSEQDEQYRVPVVKHRERHQPVEN